MCVELSASVAAVWFLQDVIGSGCVVAFPLWLLWFAVRWRCGVAGQWWCSIGASGDEVSPPAMCEERWWSLLHSRLAILTMATVIIPRWCPCHPPSSASLRPLHTLILFILEFLFDLIL